MNAIASGNGGAAFRLSSGLVLPVLWAVALVATLAVGGAVGVSLSRIGHDHALHDTYYVVAHYRSLLTLAVALVLCTAFYSLFEHVTGRRYSVLLGGVHLGLTVAAVALFFWPQVVLGFTGMPERYVDYTPAFEQWRLISNVGAAFGLLSVLAFLAVLVDAFRSSRRGGG